MMPVLRFVLAPFVDSWDGLSMTRILALGGFGLVAVSIMREKPVPQGALWLYLACVAAAFGKATFSLFLTRARLDTSVTEVTNRVITETVARRDASDHAGTEPTP